MIDCEKCKYYHNNCDGKFRCRIDVEQIRAEEIDNAIHHLDNSKVNCHENYVDGIDFAIGVLRSIAEQLKSQDSME